MIAGTRVRFASGWLRNTGQFTGPDAPTCIGPWARGNVEEVRSEVTPGNRVIEVRWDDGCVSRVLSSNLETSFD